MKDIIPKRHVNFDKPPVVEVVCGVVFRPLSALKSAHIGSLWQRFMEDFPNTDDHAALPAPPPAGPQPGLVISLGPPSELPRVSFLSDDGCRMIQVQRNRFHYNWRRKDDANEYPRFPSVFAEFKKRYSTFDEFVTSVGCDAPSLVQYELTYVNLIARGQTWEGLADIAVVLPDLGWRKDSTRFLPPPQDLHWEATYPLPKEAGVLVENVRSGRHKDTGELILLLELTARGRAEITSFDDWFEVSHEWIVKGFKDLTGASMHKDVWLFREGGP
jgi:uncharacterized protein (TIGR04255 family)